MTTLGMDGSDYEQVNQDNAELFEEELEKKRNSATIDKKKSVKALKILGLDPSKNKLSNRLGLDPEVKSIKSFSQSSKITFEFLNSHYDYQEIELAEQEEYERSEEQIKKRRSDSIETLNKKKVQKALNVLGQDPFSQRKLESKLGVDRDTLNAAVQR